MQPIVFAVDLFNRPEDHARSQEALLWLLEGLCKVNQGHLRQKPFPPIYEAGIRYVRERGTEEWLDIPHIIEAGGGDCEDLACWRVAEIRENGGYASPYVRYRLIDGHYHYHALVQHYRPEGDRLVRTKKEDPSRRLGMGESAPPKRLLRRPESAAPVSNNEA
jgi:hypothetical protein